MATLILASPAPALTAPTTLSTAVLTGGCDGYAAGTTGRITGRRQGCLVFVPDAPEQVARWSRPRAELLVPPSFAVTLD
jgi:hypothetical protein